MTDESALEREWRNLRIKAAESLYGRDRFVLITLFLSIVPIPVAPIAAVLLSVIQLRLVAAGKLDASEKHVLYKAIFISIANLLLFAAVVGILKETGAWDSVYEFFEVVFGFQGEFIREFFGLDPEPSAKSFVL